MILVANDLCNTCESCRKHLLSKADELETKGRKSLRSPGRVRQFEQIKMIDRELYKLSESDLKKAREGVMSMMKKYRD